MKAEMMHEYKEGGLIIIIDILDRERKSVHL